MSERIVVRPERLGEAAAIRAVVAAAFAGTAHAAPSVEPDGAPGEATLVTWLRADEGWIPAFSLVGEVDGEIVGHVVATRGRVDGMPALGLGPLAVLPSQQRRGIGSALVEALLAAAEAAGEPLVALLGDPAYYRRFGFRPAADLGVLAPDPGWGSFFQALPLAAYDGCTGTFAYADPFGRLGSA